MNPGYLSLLLISITVILLASGWKEVLVRGISHKVILLFFMLWLGSLGIVVHWQGWSVYCCFLLVALMSVAIVLRTEGFLQKCHLLSSGLLMGSIYFFLREAAYVLPVLMSHDELQSGMILGFSAFLLTRQPLPQTACICLGLIVGDIYFAYVHQAQGYHAALGDPQFQDRWWMAIWTARGCSLVWLGMLSGGKQAVKVWQNRGKGNRG
ncbi:hypothetical protein [Paenibacillus thalictri]|uniref:Uncharacterized protein n=1 Tax=Paenibacillus thalictri TaxID=2527873 RepID=A0A4Q9DVQ1_9BACL|nr:hypothetical protein [Paenibacillus thalictri]TBL79768.1 hypothetical protein EYB31_09190 [Paenibacillus thalictri]